MSVLTTTWRGLVERRLWPVALLLLAALAAVPFVLAKQPAPVAAAKPGATTGEDPGLATKPIVAVAAQVERGGGGLVGSKKNPFEPAPQPKAKKASGGDKAPETGASTGGSPAIGDNNKLTFNIGGADTPAGGPSIGGGTSPVGVAPAPSGESAPKKTYELYSISARWGASENGEPEAKTVSRLEPLPDGDEPLVIYLGVLEDGKTAVFMLDSGVTAQGDGTCKPSPRDCETLHMQAGDTEFFDVVTEQGEAQYQLDLVKIHAKKTKSAKAARKAFTSEAKGGRKALRSNLVRAASYRYDRATGLVERLGRKEAKVARARAARAARAAARR